MQIGSVIRKYRKECGLKVLFLHLERRWLQLNTSGKARFNHYNRHCLII